MSAGTAGHHGIGLARALAAIRRTLVPAGHLAFWTVTLDGRVAGALMREGEVCRLSLFDESRTAAMDAAATDLAALERELSARLGGKVRLVAAAA